MPQGRDDAENQARYRLIDFVLDPMPYGGVNGTLEALDMGVPVVTLVGRRHAERTSYSILTNLGVTETIAQTGGEYVDIAVRLATDPAFMRAVRTRIAAALRAFGADRHAGAYAQSRARVPRGARAARARSAGRWPNEAADDSRRRGARGRALAAGRRRYRRRATRVRAAGREHGTRAMAAAAHLHAVRLRRARRATRHRARAHVGVGAALDPDDALAHYAWAELEERAGDRVRRSRASQRAVALQPNFVAAHQRLGILHGERGDAQRAARCVLAASSRSIRATRAASTTSATRCARSAARDEARAAFERAVALQPDYELAIANVAVMWRDAGEIERAEALLRAALARPTRQAAAPRDRRHARRACCASAARSTRRSRCTQQAIAMAPVASAGEWFNLGRVFAERDEPSARARCLSARVRRSIRRICAARSRRGFRCR